MYVSIMYLCKYVYMYLSISTIYLCILDVVAHTYNLSAGEAAAGRFPEQTAYTEKTQAQVREPHLKGEVEGS